jgi:hypothetical protein
MRVAFADDYSQLFVMRPADVVINVPFDFAWANFNAKFLDFSKVPPVRGLPGITCAEVTPDYPAERSWCTYVTSTGSRCVEQVISRNDAANVASYQVDLGGRVWQQGLVWEQRFYPVDEASVKAELRTSVTLRLRVVPQGVLGKLSCNFIVGLLRRWTEAAMVELSDQLEEAYRVQREEGKTVPLWSVVQKDRGKSAPKLSGFVAQPFGPLDEEGLAVRIPR